MSIKENGFFCYEQSSTKQASVLMYTPTVEEWMENPKIGSGPDHGILHARECVTWGQLLIPILRERGIFINSKAVLLALGRHDVGRKTEKEDRGHSIRAAASLDLRRMSFIQNYDLSNTDFDLTRRLILHHSQKYDPNKLEQNELLLVRLIDRLTMIGRYQKTKWMQQDPVAFIAEVTPLNLRGDTIITRKEIKRMVKIETNLHRELKKRRATTSKDYLGIYLELAKEKGLIV